MIIRTNDPIKKSGSHNTLLPNAFPRLFNCASSRGAKVDDYVERRGKDIVWGASRNLNE